MKQKYGRVFASFMIVGALALTACTSGTKPLQTTSSHRAVDGSTWSAMYEGLRSGSLYLLLGEPGSSNVFRLNLADRKIEQLTHNKGAFGISTMSASRAGLVLGDAATGVDVVSIYKGSKSEPLMAANETPIGHAGTPAISSDGDVVYVEIPEVVNSASPQPWRITKLVHRSLQVQHVYMQIGSPLAPLAFGPNGDIAVISNPGPTPSREPSPTDSGLSTSARPPAGIGSTPLDPEILVLDASGEVLLRKAPSFAGGIVAIAWNERAPGVAVGGIGGIGEILRMDGTSTVLPNGWSPQCWKPDGTALLMTKGNEVGVLENSDLSTVRTVATVAAAITGCSWLDRPAAGA